MTDRAGIDMEEVQHPFSNRPVDTVDAFTYVTLYSAE